MPIDILDQPRGGILEATALYLYKSGSFCSIDSLTNKMTGSDDGKNYFMRNVIDLLEAAGLAEIKDEEICLKDCQALKRWPEKTKPFEMYFKVELMSKIVRSKNPYVGYFGDVLRKLFDLSTFDTTMLEESLRESRRNRGIPVSEGEELGGKMDFCATLLKYFNMIQRIAGSFNIYVPRDFLQTIISMALEDINKTSAKLYSELLDHTDRNYLPVLNRKENRILDAVHRTLNTEEFVGFFKFANVPDGGRVVRLVNKEFNAIIMR